MLRRFAPVFLIPLVLATGLLFGVSSRSQEAQAQIPALELNVLCVHTFTKIVSAPPAIVGGTCPAAHYPLRLPDSFPFTLSVNPATGMLIHSIPPPPGYTTIVLPDAGNVPLCLNLSTKRLLQPASGVCPLGQLNVLIVGQVAPDAADDGLYTTLVTGTLNEPVPGLLANDDLGLPAAQLVSFGIADATTNLAGTTVALAGGALTVEADGSFSLANPDQTGNYSFQYRLENAAGSDDATVTLQVQQLPTAVADSYTTELNVTLEVVTTDPDDLLDNDTLGFPPASVASFGVGDASANLAGATIGLAGGNLTVNANGALTLTTPTQTGAFTFDYRLENAAGFDDATVTITIDEAPTVTTTTPSDTATTVATNTNVSVTFSEHVNVADDWFEIVCATSGSYNPTGSGGATLVSVTDSDPTFMLNPNSDFASGELCVVTIVASQVTDDDASDPPDNMAGDFSFSFTTDVPPTVVSTSPLDGATDVPLNSDVSLTFSEAVTLEGGFFTLSCALSGAHTAVVSGGPTSFTLDPHSDFVLSEACTVTLVAATIHDQDAGDPPDTLDGNENGVSEGTPADDYSFSFTTPDRPPQVDSTTPVDNALSVDPTANLSVTFTEAVDVTGDWFVINCNGTLFNPSGTGGATMVTVTDGDPTYTLNPDADLPGGVICAVTITADHVSDDDAADPPDTLDGNGNDVSEGSPDDDYTFTFGTAPVAIDDSYSSLGNVGNVVPEADGLILGAGADEGAGLSVSQVQGAGGNVGVPTATSQSGSVTVAADGSFSYDPPAGFTGDDSFTYQVSGPSGTSNTATVTVTVAEMLWFIDNSDTGPGSGTLTDPFASIGNFNASGLPGTGETIFIHEGTGTYSTGIDLQNSQILIGEAAGDTIANISNLTVPSFSRSLPATGGTAPVLTAPADNAVDLATDNTVRGLDIGATAGTGLSGAEVGTLVVREVAIGGSGGGVDLGSTSGAALDVLLDSLAATSATTSGVRLAGVSGSFGVTATDGTLSITNATAVHIVGAANPNEVTLSLTFASVTAASGNNGLRVANAAGSFTVTGLVDIDSTGETGVLLRDSPATFNFQGATQVDGAAGDGIDLDGGNGAVTFASIDIDTSTGIGLRVQSNTNTVSVSGGSIGTTNDPGGNAVDVDGGSANVTVAASVTKTTAGEIVEVTGRTGGTVTFSGTLTCNSGCTGLNVSSNTSGTTRFTGSVTLDTGASTAANMTSNSHTISFSGGLDIDTTSGTGFNAIGPGGVLEVTGASNTIDTTAGTAVNVNSVTIDASGMTFLRVSAAGATHGIRLNTTGTGAFTVTGAGTTDDSGGVIQNISQRGAEFISANNISLSNMTFTNAATTNGADPTDPNSTCGSLETGSNVNCHAAIHLFSAHTVTLTNVDIDGSVQQGVNASFVSNLTITNSAIENIGNQTREHGLNLYNTEGTFLLSNSTISNPEDNGIRMYNDVNGILLMTVSMSTITSNKGTNGNDGLQMEFDAGLATILVDDSDFTQLSRDGVDLVAEDTNNAVVNITVRNSRFNNSDGFGGVIMASGGNATINTLIDNNVIQNNISNAINLFAATNSTLNATISNNQISHPNTANIGFGIRLIQEEDSSLIVDVDNNSISDMAQALLARARSVTGVQSGRLDITVTDNDGSNNGIGAQFDAGTSTGTHMNTLCLNTATADGAGNNDFTGTTTLDWLVNQRSNATFLVQGLGASAIDSFIQANNVGTPNVFTVGTGFTDVASCNTPSIPALP